MGLKGKKNSSTSIDNKCIFLDIQSVEQSDLFIDAIQKISHEYKIYTTNSSRQDCIVLENATLQYKSCLKTAKNIIVDKSLPKSFTPHKKQNVYFVPLKDNQDKFEDVQRTSRLSLYNIFSSQESANEFLAQYHLHYILGNKNVIVDFYNETQNFIKMILDNHFDQATFLSNNEKKNILIYISKITNKHQEKFVGKYLSELSQHHNYFVLSSDMSQFEFIKNYTHVQYLIYPKSRYSFQQKLILKLASSSSIAEHVLHQKVKFITTKKVKQNLKGFYFDEVIDLFDTNQYVCKELSALTCEKTYVNVHPYYIGVQSLQRWYQINEKYKQYYFERHETYNDFLIHEEEKGTCYNPCIKFYRHFSFIQNKGDCYQFNIYFRYQSLIDFDINQLKIYADDLQLNGHVQKGRLFHKCIFTISKRDIVNMPAQNKLFLLYRDQDGKGFKKDIEYTTHRHSKHNYLKSKIFNVDGHTSFYLRQSLKNRIYLTVRLHNRTDLFFENFKINFAYYLAKLSRQKIILLYEKDSSRYEESASVVYENLIDQGYKNAYFILDRHYEDIDKIQEKYRQNIIYKYTFKHYLYFFISQTFLGSELMIHSLELRNMNKHVLKKINSTDVNNVFLQHGVMYMVSLDSESRKYFNPKKDGKGCFRVVTSSQKEADHFTQLGGYDSKQVIVCGLPKYDRNVLYKDADSIVVMLTWRVWEYNQATTDFQSTPYYKMLERIIDGIDETYRDKLIILPHPLFYKAAQNNEFSLKKYMRFHVKYDEILRNTRVLITDYSSIAYDAFYRGSRVIFYWEELDDCLKKYGAHTKLMLNHKNVFGDVCYNFNELKNVLDDNYNNAQKEEYIQRYNQIVEFHDGKNTLRLIERLKSENII